MTDREILDKYTDLENSCLTKEEKNEVMEMVYKYREYSHISNMHLIYIKECPWD